MTYKIFPRIIQESNNTYKLDASHDLAAHLSDPFNGTVLGFSVG